MSSSFLGGNAAAKGQIPLPFAQNHPVEFSVVGGIAVLLLVLVFGKYLFMKNDCMEESQTQNSRTVNAIPSWDANNIYWPKVPQEEDTFRALQQNVMNQCGSCIKTSDHSILEEDGIQNRSESYVEFDARTCEKGLRLAMKAIKLRKAVGAPPAMSWVFDSIDLNPRMVTRINIGGVSTFNAAPVQCLESPAR
ncbi:MAG: hypothetical protein QM808_02660 [Steroidobacteraceae bacterium]